MDFKDLVRQLGERAAKMKDNALTEEATKTAFIMPFIQNLGYDIFNPMEVVPEFDADIPGLKKGEKVDYAICLGGEPKILIECKHWRQNLDAHDGQLSRYFHVTPAKFAILTNGVTYRFYTDLFDANKMDSKPFLDFDITQISDSQIEGLKKFHKSNYDEAAILTAAHELIYLNAIKQELAKELKTPTDDFVKFFAQKAYPGRLTQNVLSWLSDVVRRASNQVLNEMINDRLTSAMKQETDEPEMVGKETTDSKEQVEGAKPDVETTDEEIEGFHIVRAICRQKVQAERVVHRDAKSYFAILLDDNNRKPICRLHLNSKTVKYIETFEVEGGDKKQIQSIDEIYNFSAEILKTLEGYETA